MLLNVQEKTLLLIKPDGVARGLDKEIVARVKNVGLKVERQEKFRLTEKSAADLYSPHLGKKFYAGLLKFITSGHLIACVVAGENAIASVRELMGATDPREAAAGTIRGDFKAENMFTSDGTIKNIAHGSDSLESAEREIAIFFGRIK
ncbi:nucleoside-diphosphate kinase [candidate division WOR-1 bacterium RIFCSPLOWO2_02_FULL_46_20]|uniref:Nucleoside diphosphate kinase n=2 Tax=Saganbacteria TaxID=1703751 RepID=A0A1F4REV3_UNCSA|nr:MAG: nucleoside-diphosphate kinase [candidate division WOR-1 bacterium RIFCSPHIGHO2_02_FULL_45_12]OGC06646.1 MAG: nucleoside-diphosphate kinase [candidate division WOR-1 bacterium RIFCSPLOWO2_02_FULL_46_20]OGC08787.1 MAG: nucleoside-diphosphate kinase [candidate division WOR-1 bacterium RIFCSPLOWO2_12_FULL_45_9]